MSSMEGEDSICGCCEDIFYSYMNCSESSRNSSSGRPKEEDAKTWSRGLQHLLSSTYGTALFRAFLQKEYAEENLDFILKVKTYRECSPRKRQKMAWKLYKTYIAIGAPHELNLDIISRKVTDLAMITPHVSTFDAAHKRVLNLLENDAYVRFLRWDIYLQLVSPSADDFAESNL